MHTLGLEDELGFTQQVRTHMASYECYDEAQQLVIDDPVWGHEEIGDWEGDGIFTELFLHPVFQRLAAVEQLTLPGQYITIPETDKMPRFEHVWGSVVFVRKMIQRAEAGGQAFTAHEKLVLQLRTLLSDAGHTAFSHLGDWLRQGYGGPENYHDLTLADFLETTRVNDILRRRGIDPAEVIFPEGEDWVESPKPELCVDRVDYVLREAMRWLLPEAEAGEWLEAFMLTKDGKLVMRNRDDAKLFASLMLLEATEHWGEPVHRLQEHLFGQLIKGALLDEPKILRAMDMHPRDRLYAIDLDIMNNTRYPGVNHDLHDVMTGISQQAQAVFPDRQIYLQSFLANYDSATLDQAAIQALNGRPKAEIVAVDNAPTYSSAPHLLTVPLPAFAVRAVDPLFYDEDGIVKRLSETDETYRQLLDELTAKQRKTYVAQVHLAPAVINRITTDGFRIDAEWEKQMKRRYKPAHEAAFRNTLRSIGGYAIGTTPLRMRLWGGRKPDST